LVYEPATLTLAQMIEGALYFSVNVAFGTVLDAVAVGSRP
jgi:hypothetical protein